MPMTDAIGTQALVRLATWMSPAFPIGAFSYSGGLEQAVHDGLVTDAEDLAVWLGALLTHGSSWNDAVLLTEAYHALVDAPRLGEVQALAEALTGSAERHRETMLQGEAFLTAARAWPHPALSELSGSFAYPVAVGAVASAHGIGVEAALAAYLHGTLSNLVSVAIRCGVCGQTHGVAVLARLEPVLLETAGRAAHTTLDDLGSATMMADIAALAHETLPSRLFRS